MKEFYTYVEIELITTLLLVKYEFSATHNAVFVIEWFDVAGDTPDLTEANLNEIEELIKLYEAQRPLSNQIQTDLMMEYYGYAYR